MSEGSSPWGAPVAPGTKHERDEIVAEGFAAAPETAPRIPAFPVESADRVIDSVSRLAGPAVFLVALAAVGWWIFKTLF